MNFFFNNCLYDLLSKGTNTTHWCTSKNI